MTHTVALLLVELFVLMSTAILRSFFYHDEINIIYRVWVVVACLCCSTAVELFKHCCKNNLQNDNTYYLHIFCDMSLPQ